MRSIQKPKNKKAIIIPVVIAALLLIGGGAYIWLAKPFSGQQTAADTSPRPVNTVDYSPATEEEKNDSETAKQKIIDEQDNPPAPSSSIVVTIVRANQTGAGQPLTIRTSVEGATSGTCAATLTKGEQTAAGTGTIAFNATSYSCNIDVPASSFNSGGEWQLSVTANNGTATSQAATQQVTITK